MDSSSGSLVAPQILLLISLLVQIIKHNIREARRHIFPLEYLPEELQDMIIGYALIKRAEVLPGNVQYTSFVPGAATYSLAKIGPLPRVN
ncbi:hypothetical protein PRZ48_010243 [Zasmidium cellare]|uniref:Uncharacterized protein n=1 Tax=Zasmidium cellare TaxID=395010 RepID=A0ABR0E8M5_ZASCE|nr:hypothetical protein PRZ48_010243 [Zasmidium cellare]